MTHSSYFENKENGKSNDRYVFAGMYAFKGEAAKIAVKYFKGSGTQLQHLLGNAFTNENLHALFDSFKLMDLVLASNSFDVKKHKHIFMYAILGCMLIETKDPLKVQQFIMKYFFQGMEDKLAVDSSLKYNYRTQADFLAKHLFKQKLLIEVKQNEDVYLAKVYKKDGELLVSEQSKSYRYAHKKVMKSAIRIMSGMLAQPFEQNPAYQQTLIDRIEMEKQEKDRKVAQKLAEKKKKLKDNEEKRKQLAEIRNKARLKAKAEAKVRRLELKKIAEQKAARASRPQSAKKRRFLEDKKK